MNFLKRVFHIVFFTKKKFIKPTQKEILVYDRSLSENLIKFLPKEKTDILDTRFLLEKNASINVSILLKILLKFKFSIEEYVIEYIRLAKPKIVITHICNDLKFYKLKKFFPNTQFIIIQHGRKSSEDHEIFSYKNNRKTLRKLNLKCDYLFVHNFKVGKMYQSKFGGKIFPIGSFDSNSEKKNQFKKYKFLLISNLRMDRSLTKYPALRKDLKFLNLLSKFTRRNNIKITVLGAHKTQSLQNKEFMLYKKIFNKNFSFIPRVKKRRTYKILDNAEIAVNIDSTAGYEAASRGTKVAFFATKGNSAPYNSLKFGWPIKKKNKGLFWTSDLRYSEIERIITNLKKLRSSYFKKIIKREMKNIMIFNPGNSQFKEILNKILNDKVSLS